MTNYRLEKMEIFGDYMLKIDPNANYVKQKYKGDAVKQGYRLTEYELTSVDKHVSYCESW